MILVSGSRKWPRHHKKVITDKLIQLNPDIIVCGGATGVDEWARRWCRMNGRICIIHYADWESRGKAAGVVRNMEMFDKHAKELTGVVAFPYGEAKGTWHMVRYVEDRLACWDNIYHMYPKPRLEVVELW